MTNIIVGKIEDQRQKKKERKLEFTHYKQKTAFKDGVLNLPKSFLKK